MTAQPIDPDHIRPGDVVEQVTRTRMTVAEVCESRFTSAGLYVEPTDDGCWDHTITTYELVSRPAPKPEVGQHWLDDDGREYVVIVRQYNSEPPHHHFIELDGNGSSPLPATADVAPAGWTQK